MKARKRLTQSVLIFAVALTLSALALSCSGKGSTAGPIMPPSVSHEGYGVELRGKPSGEGHTMLGFCTALFDPATGSVQMIFHRTVEAHLNLTSFLSHQNCPNNSCLTWFVKGYDPLTATWFIDMQLVNPTTYAPYDLRIVFMYLPGSEKEETAWKVANADSYTNNWDEDKPWDKKKQWLNPFIAFEKEDFDRRFLADPDGSGPKTYADTEQLQLYIPPGSPSGEISMVVDACWPGHCFEPYQIFNVAQSDPLPPSSAVSSVYFEAIIADWGPSMGSIDPDITDVSVYIPDIISDSNKNRVQMHEWPTTGPKAWPPVIDTSDGMSQQELNFYLAYVNFSKIEGTLIKFPTLRKWYCNITNEKKAPSGKYDAIVIAKSTDPGGQGFDTLYQRCVIQVASGGTDPTKNPFVVFSSYRDGSADLFLYLINQKKTYKLSTDFQSAEGVRSDELEVCINRTSTRIAFISNYDKSTGTLGDFELYTLDLAFAGGEPVLLSPASWVQRTVNTWDDRQPDFSPDSSKIAYAAYRNAQYDIYTIDLNVPGAPHRVTKHLANDQAPAYDRITMAGTKLYYQSNRAGGGNTEIFYVDPTKDDQTSLPTRVTFNSGFDGYPASSITGDLAFVTERWGAPEIMRYNGTDFFRLTENTASDTFPYYSPDGKWIVFSSNRTNSQFEIYRMPYNGGDAERFTNEPTPDIDPCYGEIP